MSHVSAWLSVCLSGTSFSKALNLQSFSLRSVSAPSSHLAYSVGQKEHKIYCLVLRESTTWAQFMSSCPYLRFDGVWIHLSLSSLCCQKKSAWQDRRSETLVRHYPVLWAVVDWGRRGGGHPQGLFLLPPSTLSWTHNSHWSEPDGRTPTTAHGASPQRPAQESLPQVEWHGSVVEVHQGESRGLPWRQWVG